MDSNWAESALGQYLLNIEQAFYHEQVADIFGYHALQLGFHEVDLLATSRIPSITHCSPAYGQVMAEPEYMPFDRDSIDLICLPHALEFCDNPHQSLREIERLLVPEGYLVLTGFNPWSLWGLRRRLATAYPWHGRHLSAGRIKDWLKLLGFELIDTGCMGYAMPFDDEKWLYRQRMVERLHTRCCPLTGGVYYIVAKKRVVNMHLLKPKWSKAIAPKLITSPSKPAVSDVKEKSKR